MQTKVKYLNQSLVDRIRECMICPLTVNGIDFTIPVDIEVGYNWLELEDWEKVKHEFLEAA